MMKWMYKLIIFVGLVVGSVACKKDNSSSIELSIAADEVYHPAVLVSIQEIWLNYATKKSKSEWLKLDIASGVYDLAYLNVTMKDTVVLPQTRIEKLETLLQVRVIFGEQSNSLHTLWGDTLDLKMDPLALSGIKVSLNKAIEKGKRYDLRLAIKADSVAIHQNAPIFSPTIRVDSLVVVE